MANLSCTDGLIDERYSFYKHIDEYLQYEKNCPQGNHYNQYENKCKLGISYDDREENIISAICLRFYCLMYNILKSDSSQYTRNEHIHLEYLKYWLNYELHNKIADTYPILFHKYMKINNPSNPLVLKLDKIWDNIDDDELENMNLLFYFYINCIYIIKSATKVDANDSFAVKDDNHCVQKYQELEIK
ncbi:CYIR protein, partial [Plasmodium cynomolgi strain B]